PAGLWWARPARPLADARFRRTRRYLPYADDARMGAAVRHRLGAAHAAARGAAVGQADGALAAPGIVYAAARRRADGNRGLHPHGAPGGSVAGRAAGAVRARAHAAG